MDIFCKIARHEIPAEIVFENDKIVAFRDVSPKAKTHILIIPKDHIASLSEVSADLIGEMMAAAVEIAKKEGIYETGFRLITNSGPDSGQEVPHLHFHLLGGQKLSALN